MDDTQADDRLNTMRAWWDRRAPTWNEQNLRNWNTAETAAWWHEEWMSDVGPYLPAPGSAVQLLDAGCGNGQLSVLYALEGYTVRGCDLSAKMVQFATANAARTGLTAPQVEFVQASVDAMPYRDARFDVVNCRCVLDFTPRPAYTLRELRRVIKDGGTLVLQMMGAGSPIKTDSWLRWLHGLFPEAESFTFMLNNIAPWEVEKIMPYLGWELLHESGVYGTSASGAVNQFSKEQLADQPIMVQQALATAWRMVARAVAPQTIDK